MTVRQFLYGVLCLAAIHALAGTAGDPDLWGHVRFGQDILAEGKIRLPDVYSFTSDRDWINHEWLAELLFALAYNGAGPAGLNGLRIAISLVLLALIWREGASLGTRRILLVVMGALGMYVRGQAIRPQLFSLLMFCALLTLLTQTDNQHRLRRLAWIPLLMALWVNLHGGWIVGVGFLAAWCAAAATSRPSRDRLALAAVLASSFAATVVNPYGAGMWAFLAETVRLGRPNITDWQPLYVFGPAYWISWGAGLAMVIVGAARARSRTDWLWMAMAAALGAAAIRVSRLDGFFALAATFAAAGVLSRREPSSARVAAARPLRALAVLFAFCVIAGSIAIARRATRIPIPVADQVPDLNVAAFVKEQRLSGRVLMWFDWGEYAIWHFGPQLKVSIDGRRETVYGPEVIAGHLRFYFDPREWSYADRLQADYVWLPKRLPAVAELRRHGWLTTCEGPSSVLLARHSVDAPCPAAIAGGQRFFPGL